MKFRNSIPVIIVLIVFSAFVSCSSPPHSKEEIHILCEISVEKVDWLKSASTADISIHEPLSALAPRYKKNNTPLCLYEIIKIEPSETGNNTKLTLSIKEVFSGDLSIKGQEVQGYVGISCVQDSSQLIGLQYIGYLNCKNKDYCLFYPFWTFLVTDDNILVSPFGCLVEESQLNGLSEYNFSMDCRNYTGQPLDYFLEKVKEAE